MKFPTLIIVLFFILQSCSESEESPAIIIDKTLLTNPNGWVIKSAVEETTEIKTNLFQNYLPCVADNIYRLATNSRYGIHEGPKKCVDTDPNEKESGNWVLNGSSLVLSPAGTVPYQFTISSLTAEELVCTYLKIGTDGIVISVTTITFKVSEASGE
jgi:hypothetical protein